MFLSRRIFALAALVVFLFPLAAHAQHEVTSVELAADPPSEGKCPQSVTFRGSITVFGGGVVTYTFVRSDGSTAPAQKLDFPNGGTQPISYDWLINPPAWGASSYEGWVAVKILSPNELTSNAKEGSFTLTCAQQPVQDEKPIPLAEPQVDKQPFRVTDVALWPESPMAKGPCPVTIDFRGTITATGPGVVKYTFGRSDGATGPIEAIEFFAAGSQEVRTTWTLGSNEWPTFNGWQTLRVVSPNELESTQKQGSFSLTCGGAAAPAAPPAAVDPGIRQPIDASVARPIDRQVIDAGVRGPITPPTGLPANDPRINVGTLNPGAIDAITRGLSFDGWDFETGDLQGWASSGTAFERQPTLGDNVVTERMKPEMRLDRGGIGGDYWKRVAHPIGHQGNYWIGTYEDRPDEATPLGTVAGDAATGELVSPLFNIDKRFLSFLIGGGQDVNRLHVQLLVRATAAQIEEARRSGGQPVRIGLNDFLPVAVETGRNSELMRQAHWDLGAYRGRAGVIRIVDNSSGGWGHINADNFRFTDEVPRPDPTPVWGYVDTHAHPANYLGFGTGLIQGKLYSPDGNPATALPRIAEANPHTRNLLNFVKWWRADVTTGGGYPEFDNYPKFDNGMGQQMYQDWIKRAYEGGLRLMAGLSVNNWLLSSHQIKRDLFGTVPELEDDRDSGNAQVEDIKRWANRPENRTWVEIALTPADARRIIGQNKLAVVLGVEADVLGNIVPNNSWEHPDVVVMPPDEASQRRVIAAELDRLYAAGVRQITPFHYVSGVFGGTAIFNRFFNEVHRKFTGSNYVVESGDRWRIRYRLNNDGWGTGDATAREIATGHSRIIAWDQSWERVPRGHVNSMGLTRAGEILFEEMARRGMLLDTDHASFKTTQSLMALAARMDYPVMSSHSDPLELGYTGDAEFTHDNFNNHDNENLGRFGTTLHDNLRHEGMTPDEKFLALARVGGVTGPILSTYRRGSYRNGSVIPNDCDGCTKTWAQMYLYAAEKMGGKGVGLSSDRGFINFIAPRFGPNAAFMLGFENHESLKTELRRRYVQAQRNGVRYDSPIREWRSYRFKVPGQSGTDPAGQSAYRYTGKSWEYEDIWRALAAFKAGRNPWTMGDDAGIQQSGAPFHGGRIIELAKGFFAETEEQLESDCGIGRCGGDTIAERYSAFAVRHGLRPDQLSRWGNDARVREFYGWVHEVWTHWHHMEGANDPLRRHVFGNRDFDINIDGAAHYGMLPDILQDIKNSHVNPEQFSTTFAPLFRSAEDYIRMWEKAVARAR